MRTYWNASVRNDKTTSSVGIGGQTLAAAISTAITEAIYMQAVNPGAKISITDIEEHCAVCYNNGTVLKPHSRVYGSRMRCPECKGKVPTAKVEDIRFTMPDPANHITLSEVA